MSSQICADRANRLPSDPGTTFPYSKPFTMQNIGPKDLFLQMLGWKKVHFVFAKRDRRDIFKAPPCQTSPYSGSRQCRSAECKDFDVTFRDETFNQPKYLHSWFDSETGVPYETYERESNIVLLDIRDPLTSLVTVDSASPPGIVPILGSPHPHPGRVSHGTRERSGVLSLSCGPEDVSFFTQARMY